MKFKRTAILSLSFLTIMATDTVAPLIGQMSVSFPEVSPALLKQTITLPALLAIFFGLLAGQLVKIISKKAVLAIALTLYTVGGIAGGWTTSFTAHLLMRSLLGAGTGLISPIITSLIADFYYGKQRAEMVGYSFAISHLGGVVTPPLAAFIGANDWRIAFLIYAIAPLILAAAMLFIPPSPRSEMREAGKITTPISRSVIWLSIISFIVILFFFIIITDIPFLIASKPQLAEYVIAFGLSVSTLGSAITGLAFSWLYAKMKIWIVPSGFLVCAFGFILTVYTTNNILALIGLLATGLGLGVLISLVLLLTANSTGDADSTAALAVVNSAFSVGMFTSPFFYALLPRLFSPAIPIIFNFKVASMFFLLVGILTIPMVILINSKSLTKVQSIHGS
jgi:predicted MFS family arabinose efflux permease